MTPNKEAPDDRALPPPFARSQVISVFYGEKDLVFEPALVGDWIYSPDELWRFENPGGDAYRLILVEERKGTVLEAHLFKLQGQLFLDVASIEQDYHVIPPHYLLKVSQVTPTLRMS